MIQRKDNWTRARGETYPPQKASASSRGVANLLWKSNFQGYLFVHAWLRNRVGWVGLSNYKPSESFLDLAFPIISGKKVVCVETQAKQKLGHSRYKYLLRSPAVLVGLCWEGARTLPSACGRGGGWMGPTGAFRERWSPRTGRVFKTYVCHIYSQYISKYILIYLFKLNLNK